jgi:hypothetical protein
MYNLFSRVKKLGRFELKLQLQELQVLWVGVLL